MSTFRKKYYIFAIAMFLVVLALLGFYGYKSYYSFKFNIALEQASKISPDVWDVKYESATIKDKYKVVIITNNGGELTYSEYFKYAAEKLGWEVQIYYNQALGNEPEILNFDPDFIIFSQFSETTPDLNTKIIAHRSKKYLLSFSSIDAIRNRFKWIDNKNPYEATRNFKKFISMVDGILTIAPELDFYRVMFEKLNKPFNGLRILPLVPKFNNEPTEPKSLMWLSGGWDKFRSSDNYKKFITMLSENVPMKVYGHYNSSSYLKPHIYGGYITPGIEQMNAIRSNGIYLLTHSDVHFQGGETNMRGFEATAANTIVISDKHPFIIQNFGDSFLYFDHDKDAETMYKQVKTHIDWIKNHPDEAKAKAARAHQIFLDKFTIEKDLARIAKMHESILETERKSMDLSYPLGY